MKNKKHFCYFFVLGLMLVVSFFILRKTCLAEPILKIIDVQFDGGTGKADEDFIKIKNNTDQEINLDEYRLAKQTSAGKKYDIKSFGKDNIISAEKTFLWASNKIKSFPSSIDADTSTSQTISKDNGVAIIFGSLDDGEIIDSLNWKSEQDDEEDGDDEDNKKDYSDIKINEIYPAPDTKNEEEEFVEIKNNSKDEIDFSGWIIKDSKGKKGKISHTKKEGNFFVFYGSFSLNNDSNGDAVFIYDEKNNLVDSQDYTNGKSAYSYSFDGSAWRWTSSSTPGQENTFDKILSGKIIRDEKIYIDTYAYFDVKADKDAKKFTWNFGDGHKSYLKSTKHKYKKAGKYSASLKIAGKGEDKIYEFEVKVEKYKAPKIRIIALSPNPQGNDTDNEWIEIENKSKKKVNLKNWSIATGWKNLVNHPIREDFEIKAGKTKKLLRDICAFALVNTKDKIELRSPDGKTVQKITYEHGESSVEEDEIYKKINSSWEWVPSPNKKEFGDENLPSAQKETSVEEITFSVPGSELQANLGKYTTSPDWQKKKDNRTTLVYSNHGIILSKNLIKDAPILGAKTAKIQNNYYTFTYSENRKFWTVEFLKSVWLKLNYGLNKLLFKI